MDLLALTRAADCLPPCAAQQPSAWLIVGLFWAAGALVIAIGLGVLTWLLRDTLDAYEQQRGGSSGYASRRHDDGESQR